MFLTRARDCLIETTAFHILFKLGVPEIVQIITKLLRQLPSIRRWQLTNRLSNFGHTTHRAILH